MYEAFALTKFAELIETVARNKQERRSDQTEEEYKQAKEDGYHKIRRLKNEMLDFIDGF